MAATDVTITRNGHVIRLTDEEIEAAAAAVQHKERMQTCRMMAHTFLASMGMLDTNAPRQIEFFLDKVIPEHEQERLVKIYESHRNELITPYHTWSGIISAQFALRDSLMCRTIRGIIYDKTSVEVRTKIMGSKKYNRQKKTNLDAVLQGLTASNLIAIWKDFKFIQEI